MWVLAIPIVIIILFISTVIFLLCKKWRIAAASALCCLLLNMWSETFPLNLSRANEIKDGTFRIATYNIDCLGSGEKHEGWEIELMEFIDGESPDILFLAEFQYHKGAYDYLLDSISKTFFFRSVVDVKYGRKDVIYSKYPIKNFSIIDINPAYCQSEELYKEITEKYYQGLKPMIYNVTVDVNGEDIQFICCHLASNEFNVAKKQVGNKGIGVVLRNLTKGYLYREIEARSIVEEIESKDRVVLMGDLNDIGGSSVLSIFKAAGLKDAWWQAGRGYGFTYYKQGLYYCLDHIMISDKITVQNIRIPKCNASDHYPLVADIKIE